MLKKVLIIILVSMLGLLQYRLWLGKNSVSDYQKMQSRVDVLTEQNANLTQRNNLLKADIKDLQLGLNSIEERARNELGMIKDGETFYRILPQE